MVVFMSQGKRSSTTALGTHRPRRPSIPVTHTHTHAELWRRVLRRMEGRKEGAGNHVCVCVYVSAAHLRTGRSPSA